MDKQEKDYKLLIIFNGGIIYKSPTYNQSQIKSFRKRVEEDIKEVNNNNIILIYTDDEDDEVYIQKNIAMNSLFVITPNWRRLIEDEDNVDITPADIEEVIDSKIEGDTLEKSIQ